MAQQGVASAGGHHLQRAGETVGSGVEYLLPQLQPLQFKVRAKILPLPNLELLFNGPKINK